MREGVGERETIEIPMPIVMPLGGRLDKVEYVQEVWDAFVKPEQDAELPPSVEMRLLMAILRAVAAGLDRATGSNPTPEQMPDGEDRDR